MTDRSASMLATRRGKLLLLLLCAVQFLDAVFLLAAAVIALRATSSRGEPAAAPAGVPAAGQVPAPEPAD